MKNIILVLSLLVFGMLNSCEHITGIRKSREISISISFEKAKPEKNIGIVRSNGKIISSNFKFLF